MFLGFIDWYSICWFVFIIFVFAFVCIIFRIIMMSAFRQSMSAFRTGMDWNMPKALFQLFQLLTVLRNHSIQWKSSRITESISNDRLDLSEKQSLTTDLIVNSCDLLLVKSRIEGLTYLCPNNWIMAPKAYQIWK